jgi:hypothetical protein
MAVLSFDQFACTLASRASRRGTLALLATVALPALSQGTDTLAGQRRRNTRRKRRRNKRHARCLREGATCNTADVYCSGTCDFLVKDGSCAPCRGRSCSAEHPCCGSLDCVNGFCDGCRDRATSCTTAAQCCFSDCTGGACLSAQRGPCARHADCRSCYLNGACTNACVNGACAV